MLPILFKSTDQGAPVLNNAAGSLISVLDACLVTGFNSLGATSLQVVSNVCTVTTAASHGYQVGQRVLIAGASTSTLNGDKTVVATPTATTFTFAVTQADGSETPGSASVKRTPLGWVKEFSGTNKAVYQMTDAASYGQRLRVDDSTAGVDARVIGVENPTTVDAYSDAFPTDTQRAGGGYWSRGANNTTAKFWAIVGDERFFYYIVEHSARNGPYRGTNIGYTGGYFGDILSFKNGEAYGCIIGGCHNTTSIIQAMPAVLQTAVGTDPGTTHFRYICRQHTGVTKSIQTGFAHPGGGSSSSSSSSSSYPVYPSPIDNGLVFAEPSFVVERLINFGHPIRGVLPGAVQVLARYADLAAVLYGETVTANDGSGLKVIIFRGACSSYAADSALALKLSTAWR